LAAASIFWPRGAPQSGGRLYRGRGLSQRLWQDPAADHCRSESEQHPPVPGRWRSSGGGAARSIGRTCRLALSRSLAQTPALEAALRATFIARRALARLLPIGAVFRFASDWPDYLTWTLMHVRRHPAFVVARRFGDRLARALAALARNALRGQGHARGTQTSLSHIRAPLSVSIGDLWRGIADGARLARPWPCKGLVLRRLGEARISVSSNLNQMSDEVGPTGGPPFLFERASGFSAPDMRTRSQS
jgi:hypothetical protein